MTFKLQLPPVPRVSDEALRRYLETERSLLFVLVAHLNRLGCGLQFDTNDELAVKIADSSLTCDGGLKVVPSAIDHGGLGGLDADDHLQYVSLAPIGDRNQMLVGEVNTTGLEITAPAAYVGKFIQGLDSTLAQTFSVEADGKGEFTDLDEGFSDPNSHFQASNASLQARMEELGFVLKEHTRYWRTPQGLKGWANSPTMTYAAAMRTFYYDATTGADRTIVVGEVLVPAWYQVDGSTTVTVEIDWAVPAAPGADQVWVLALYGSGYSATETIPALTATSTNVTVSTVVTAYAVYTTTVNLTAPSFAGKTWLHFEAKRLNAGNTFTNSVYFLGVRLKSGVKHT